MRRRANRGAGLARAAVQPLPRHPEVRPDARSGPPPWASPASAAGSSRAARPPRTRARERAERPRPRRAARCGPPAVGATPRTSRPTAQRRRLRAATSTSGSSGMTTPRPPRAASSGGGSSPRSAARARGGTAMKRTPVRRKLPTTTSLTTTPRAEISSCEPGKRERQVDLGAGNDERPARPLHGHPRRRDVLGLAELHVAGRPTSSRRTRREPFPPVGDPQRLRRRSALMASS